MGPRLREDTGEGGRIGGGGVWWRRGTLPMGGGRGMGSCGREDKRGGMGSLDSGLRRNDGQGITRLTRFDSRPGINLCLR